MEDDVRAVCEDVGDVVIDVNRLGDASSLDLFQAFCWGLVGFRDNAASSCSRDQRFPWRWQGHRVEETVPRNRRLRHSALAAKVFAIVLRDSGVQPKTVCPQLYAAISFTSHIPSEAIEQEGFGLPQWIWCTRSIGCQ